MLEIARAAQRISGSNLSLRIPSRKAGDELDYLIETFNQMIERLEINFNQVRQFSTDVSHELRTPITVVRGQLEVALFTAQTAEQYRDAIVNSLADIERLSQIVRALLLLSQAETGPGDSAEADARSGGTGRRHRRSVSDSGRRRRGQANVSRQTASIARANSTACRSSACFRICFRTPSNSPRRRRHRVFVDRHGEEAEIRVEDTGQGIPPEHLPHIFDRFYRVRGPSEQASPEKGLGLGLSFVAWIVRAHGGTVDVSKRTRQRHDLQYPPAAERCRSPIQNSGAAYRAN